jgi:hypothetical protein
LKPQAPDTGMNDKDDQLQRVIEESKREYELNEKKKQFLKEAGLTEDYGDELMNRDVIMEDDDIQQLRDEELLYDIRDKKRGGANAGNKIFIDNHKDVNETFGH